MVSGPGGIEAYNKSKRLADEEANEESKGKASKETAVVLTMMIDTTKTAKQKLKEAAAARRNEKA